MNWLSIPIHFILHKLHTSNTGNKQTYQFFLSVFPFPSSVSAEFPTIFVRFPVSVCASQIHVIVSSVDNLEEIIIYGTVILSPGRLTFHPKPIWWFNIINVEVDYHHVSGWSIIAWQAFLMSCFGQWSMPLHMENMYGYINHAFLVPDTLQSYTNLWLGYTESVNWYADELE